VAVGAIIWYFKKVRDGPADPVINGLAEHRAPVVAVSARRSPIERSHQPLFDPTDDHHGTQASPDDDVGHPM
jgi:hypothetical protein